MRYLTAKQISDKWGVTARRVQDLCKAGAVDGAERHGREWLIPEFAEKPIDRRAAALRTVAKNDANQIDSLQFVNLLSKYTRAGLSNEIQLSVKGQPVAQDIVNMQLRYYSGDLTGALKIALKYKTSGAGFAQHATIGYYLALCATGLGDVKKWYDAQDYLKEYVPRNKSEKELLDFLVAANASVAYDGSLFPDWFRRGDFSHLPRQMQAIARLHYVKYLYIMTHDPACIQHNIPKIEFVRVIPLIVEPLISQAVLEGSLINESYLRLMCAACYHVGGEDVLAKRHIEKAADALLPDRLYLPLAEYRNRLGGFLDGYLEEVDPKALAEIKKLSKQVNSGWIKLHNAVMKRTVSENLSFRERQICKLAIYGLSNKEIAERLGITVNAVKQALRSAMDKTGAHSRSELHHFV